MQSTQINELFEAYRRQKSNKRFKEIKIMKMLDAHKPNDTSIGNIERLIDSHKDNECDVCKQSTNCTLKELAEDLYRFNSSIPFSAIYSWIQDLFVTKSVLGIEMERNLLRKLKNRYGDGLGIRRSTAEEDHNFAIDIVFGCPKTNEVWGSIQVKPESYSDCHWKIKKTNIEKNEKFPHPVYYIYYDKFNQFIKTSIGAQPLANNLAGNLGL